MHYKNGREAKAGDKVISLPYGMVGILHTISSSSESCNGQMTVRTPTSDLYVTIKECLHLDDVAAAQVPDSTAKEEGAPQ